MVALVVDYFLIDFPRFFTDAGCFFIKVMTYTFRGCVHCPQKTKTQEGILTTLPTTPTGRRRALALTFKRDTTQKGLGEQLTKPDNGQAQK